MRRYSLLLLILLFSASLYSQEKEEACVYPVYALGISPSSFINTYRAIQISQEFGIYKPFNISLESGYIYSTYYRNRNTSGFRLRPSIEYYFGEVLSTVYSVGLFYSYRYTDDRYDFETNHSDYRYKEVIHLQKQKIFKGYGLQLGLRKDLGSGFYFNLNIGFGPGKLTVESNEDYWGVRSRREFIISDYRDGIYSKTISFVNINISYIIF